MIALRHHFPGPVTLVAALALLVPGACVERTMKIDSQPPRARVFVNDEEVGVTPAKFSFLWYGDYDIMLRKEGFHTLKTHYRVDPPWYQYPPIDLIAECFIPGTIKDEHVLPTYHLEPAGVPPVQEIVERAVELRERALYEGP
jgi:hypothetical protein